jgi:hypothetical protein
VSDFRHQSPHQRKRAGLPASVHEENANGPTPLHDNGAIVTFTDGAIVNRQHGTVQYPNWPDVTMPTKGQSRHMDIAMGWR